MLYIAELCEDCAVANEIDYEIDDTWTNILGIQWQRTTWSQRVTSDFNSVLYFHLYTTVFRYFQMLGLQMGHPILKYHLLM